MKIRVYAPGDREAVAALWRRCFSYPAPHNNPEDSIRRKTALNDGLFFVAVDAGSPAAESRMADAYPDGAVPGGSAGDCGASIRDCGTPERVIGTVMAGWDGHRGWIYSLAVDEPDRRCGIGRALVEHAVAVLKMRDCPKVNLQVMPGNNAVIGFYEKLGFTCEERTSMGRKLY